MSLTTTKIQNSLPPELESKLTEFRKRVALVKLGEGALCAIFGLILSYLAVFVSDRFFETPTWARFALLILGIATIAVGLPLKWYQWVWRLRALEAVARLIKQTFPGLGDQLLGIVELVHRPEHSMGRSERLVAAAISQTAAAVKDKDFSKAVPHAHHRQWGLAALSVLVLAVLAFVLVMPAAANAWVRWVMPWSDTERFTFARVESLPETMVVPYDEPFSLPVYLAANTSWSPGTGWGKIAGQPLVESQIKDRTYTFNFAPQIQNSALSIWMGDVRKTIQIEPKTRPELSEIQVHVKLPEYLGYTVDQNSVVRGGAVSILKGSQASFEAAAIRTIEKASVNDHDLPVAGGKIVTAFEPINSDLEKTFSWSDHDGLAPHDPLVLKVNAVEDQPPGVVATRDSLEQVILDSEVVTINLTATDDYGVKEMGLDWVGSQNGTDGKTPACGSKLVALGGPMEKEAKVCATFCATQDGVEPQTLELRAWATDYLPERTHSHSAAMILHILNKSDHAQWLTNQFGRWLEAAKETYEREQQLNEANKELRAMTPQELDRPENRRRVAQQATAENENAARLSSLNDSAKNLVEQATKNDEFDAKRLESLATLLKSLQDIAANRMPSVADLLKQSAGAQRAEVNPSLPQNASQNPGTQPPISPTPKSTAPTVASNHDGSAKPSGTPQIAIPNGPQKTPAPGLSDHEGGYFPTQTPQAGGAPSPPKPPGTGKLRLPTTVLDAAPGQKQPPSPPTTPAQHKMDDALQQQSDLLAEFSKVSDQLAEIMTSLDASTFVKRFKAASRNQMKIASDLTKNTLSSFGSFDAPEKPAQDVAKQTKDQSETVRIIESDLDAYYERKHDERFKITRDEMRDSGVVDSITSDGERAVSNLSGEAIAGSEFWADTLDRWAEEMVAASKCKACSSCSGDSLPPEIVLKVMKALRGEMSLRDMTREAENVKPALDAPTYLTKAQMLAKNQGEQGNLISSAQSDIFALPEGAEKFPKELALLQQAGTVMQDSQGILGSPETGSKAIAAETEVIELLLQSKRSSPKSGGGSGSDAGHGGTALSASEAALADFGPGADAQSNVVTRNVAQSTGQSGKEFPDEYKTGLDAYFSNLEKQVAK